MVFLTPGENLKTIPSAKIYFEKEGKHGGQNLVVLGIYFRLKFLVITSNIGEFETPSKRIWVL